MDDNSYPIMYSVTPCDVLYRDIRGLVADIFSVFGSIGDCFDTMDETMECCAETADTMMSCFDSCS
jgi:hypothetical protein